MLCEFVLFKLVVLVIGIVGLMYMEWTIIGKIGHVGEDV